MHPPQLSLPSRVSLHLKCIKGHQKSPVNLTSPSHVHIYNLSLDSSRQVSSSQTFLQDGQRHFPAFGPFFLGVFFFSLFSNYSSLKSTVSARRYRFHKLYISDLSRPDARNSLDDGRGRNGGGDGGRGPRCVDFHFLEQLLTILFASNAATNMWILVPLRW